MYNKEEEKLNDYKKMYDNVPVALQSLDEAIMVGFQRARLEEKRKPYRRKWLYSLATAAILLIGFFTTIRLSPAFANYITVIPGMDKVVHLIGHDKGMKSAIENDYYQEIGVSKEKNGLEVIIDGAIADENGLILFYTLKSEKKQKKFLIEEAQLKSVDGEKLNFSSFSYVKTHDSDEGKTSFNGSLEYFFTTPFKTREFELALDVKGDISGEYTIPFTLKKKIEEKKTYVLDKTVTVEGQKMTFVSATVYPLRVAVHVKKDPNNSKRILNFDDLRLVDENGESWNKIANGTSANKISDDEEIIYLQSNYFRQPKELYLAFNKVQAVDKDEEYVIVDIENEKILKQPKGNFLSDVKIEGSSLDFTTPLAEKSPNFSEFKDINGKEIELESAYFQAATDEGVKSFGYNLPGLKKQKGPISLKLFTFPSWIEGDVKIKIK